METSQHLPKLGQEWPSIPGSAYAGITTNRDGKLYALVLLADKTADELKWEAGMAWAESLNADLPSRVDGALLFANLSDRFEKNWHWTNEQYSGASAWVQNFGNGGQSYRDKRNTFLCRAVRRLPLESFDPFEGLTKRAAAGAAQLRSAATDLLTACDAADTALRQVAA